MNTDFIGGLAVLILLIAGGLLVYRLKRNWRRRHWIPITGTVSTHKTGISTSYDTPIQVFAAVTYTYKVNGKMYWGEFQEIVRDEPAARHMFEKFPKGSPITLLRHPRRPELSCFLPQNSRAA